MSVLGLNLVIYPSSLEHASRVRKIGTSLQQALAFDATEIVGMQPGGLPGRESVADRVTLVRVRGSALGGNLGRILKVLLWQPRVYLAYRRRRVAVVAAQNVWILPMCWRLARATGAVLAYNAHELETETISMKGFKQWLARRIEARYISRARVISVVNDPIADWYAQAYSIDRPVVLGNSPLVGSGAVDLREWLGLSDTAMIYVHTGNLAGGRNIPLILATFRRHPECHVVFVGDGPLRNDVEKAAAECTNIHWLAPIAHNEVVSMIRSADVGLCLIELTSMSLRLSSPNKLLESLAAGRPVLCSDFVEARRLLGSRAQHWILDDPEAELELAISGIKKRHVREFEESWTGLQSWEQQVSGLIEGYAKALEESGGAGEATRR